MLWKWTFWKCWSKTSTTVLLRDSSNSSSSMSNNSSLNKLILYIAPYFRHRRPSTPDFDADLARKTSSISEHLLTLVDQGASVVCVDNSRSAWTHRRLNTAMPYLKLGFVSTHRALPGEMLRSLTRVVPAVNIVNIVNVTVLSRLRGHTFPTASTFMIVIAALLSRARRAKRLKPIADFIEACKILIGTENIDSSQVIQFERTQCEVVQKRSRLYRRKEMLFSDK